LTWASGCLYYESAMHTETILLVEDDTSLRSVMRLYLEHTGYQVLDADNGVDALFIGSQYDGPIHLLFTDVEMSPMSGPELAEQLLLHRPYTQVLFMSGNHTEDRMLEGLYLLNAKFIGKPFNPKMVGAAVRDVLNTDIV
jgi:two-component system, cell cycle sensor histidine kinase and response regulator CckA